MAKHKKKKTPVDQGLEVQRVRSEAELMHWAWVVIRGAYSGNWKLAPAEWRDAAMTWRAAYYRHLIRFPLPHVEPIEDVEVPEAWPMEDPDA